MYWSARSRPLSVRAYRNVAVDAELAPRTSIISSVRSRTNSGSRTLYGSFIRSATVRPVSSPAYSVLTRSCSTCSVGRPVSSSLTGTGGGASADAEGAVAAIIDGSLPPGERHEHFDELDCGRPDGDDPHGREDAEHQREHH